MWIKLDKIKGCLYMGGRAASQSGCSVWSR